MVAKREHVSRKSERLRYSDRGDGGLLPAPNEDFVGTSNLAAVFSFLSYRVTDVADDDDADHHHRHRVG